MTTTPSTVPTIRRPSHPHRSPSAAACELHITLVRTDRELEEFIAFPWEVYRGDPNWVPPLAWERREFLDRERNPFFDHGRAEYFLARRGDRVVGSIAAITNDLYNEYQGQNAGFFGFFEVLDDAEAAAALLEKAEQWVREAGHETILGPAQFSTNDPVGLLIDGFDDPPRILMTYNPSRYRQYLESAGYGKAMDLYAYALAGADLRNNIPEKVLRVTEKIRKRWNLTLRPVDMKNLERDIAAVKRIYNASWEKNWGFVPMTERELDHMVEQMKAFMDPELAILVERDGEVIAFAMALPDLNQPLRLANPGPSTPKILTLSKLLWHWKARRRVDWMRVWALGVAPQYKGKGLDSMLYLDLARSVIRKFEWVEMSWILETNPMIIRGIELMGGRKYKTYRMYEKPLSR